MFKFYSDEKSKNRFLADCFSFDWCGKISIYPTFHKKNCKLHLQNCFIQYDPLLCRDVLHYKSDCYYTLTFTNELDLFKCFSELIIECITELFPIHKKGVFEEIFPTNQLICRQVDFISKVRKYIT